MLVNSKLTGVEVEGMYTPSDAFIAVTPQVVGAVAFIVAIEITQLAPVVWNVTEPDPLPPELVSAIGVPAGPDNDVFVICIGGV